MSKLDFGIVIRQDGTVPFDDGVHPTHRHAMLSWLIEQGHKLEDVPGTKHVRIKNWKPSHS